MATGSVTSWVLQPVLLRDRLLREIKAEEDSLRFYFLDEKSGQRIEHHGVDKPLDLTEPLIRSTEYRFNWNQQIPPYPCTVVTEVVRPEGEVPHYFPGTNPMLEEFYSVNRISHEVYKDGAATMYPEYRLKLQEYANAN